MIVAAALALSLAWAQPSDYPLEAILDEGREACATALARTNLALSDFPGWAVLPPQSADSPIMPALVQMAPDGMIPIHPVAILHKVTSGRTIYLLVGDIDTPQIRARTCTLQEPTASLDLGPDRLAAWAGRAPITPLIPPNHDTDEMFRKLSLTRVWRPGLTDGADDTIIAYVNAEMVPGGAGSGIRYNTSRVHWRGE